MNKSKGKGQKAKKGASFSFQKVDAYLDSVWKKMTAKIPENVLTSIILLTFGAVVLCAWILPQRIEEYHCNRFAKPLFEHRLPSDSYAVQTSAARDDEGGTTAAIILGTASGMTQQELYAFYADGEYLPANKGEAVVLTVKELDEGSLSALRQAGMYRESDEYFFIYIYSADAQ
jgi:hypothetical protein